jgi:hypothetical protein
MLCCTEAFCSHLSGEPTVLSFRTRNTKSAVTNSASTPSTVLRGVVIMHRDSFLLFDAEGVSLGLLQVSRWPFRCWHWSHKVSASLTSHGACTRYTWRNGNQSKARTGSEDQESEMSSLPEDAGQQRNLCAHFGYNGPYRCERDTTVRLFVRWRPLDVENDPKPQCVARRAGLDTSIWLHNVQFDKNISRNANWYGSERWWSWPVSKYYLDIRRRT